MGFPRQQYWNGLPFPSSGELPNPGTQPVPPVSPALAGRFFTTEPPEKPVEYYSSIKKNNIMALAATWMDLVIVILSEVHQTGEEKYHMI